MATTVTDRFSGTPSASTTDRFSGTPSVGALYRLPHDLLLSGDAQVTGSDAVKLSGDAQVTGSDVVLLSGDAQHAATGTTVTDRY